MAYGRGTRPQTALAWARRVKSRSGPRPMIFWRTQSLSAWRSSTLSLPAYEAVCVTPPERFRRFDRTVKLLSGLGIITFDICLDSGVYVASPGPVLSRGVRRPEHQIQQARQKPLRSLRGHRPSLSPDGVGVLVYHIRPDRRGVCNDRSGSWLCGKVCASIAGDFCDRASR